jgi:polyisoprenoid-binding protein YceI
MRCWIILILCLGWNSAYAEWKLDAKSSTLNYVSIKKNEIGEINYFTEFDAAIQADGIFKMEIVLNSVDTRYEIRDQRMRSLFFETHKFPKAKINGKVPVDNIKSMSPGETERVAVNVTLELHGHKENIDANLRLMKMADNRFMAITENPILLNVQAFDLIDGVKQLMDAASLSGITWVVPVDFVLVFQNQ